VTFCPVFYSRWERERAIKKWAARDAAELEQYEIGVEQEPGSGGKESVESTIRNLAGQIRSRHAKHRMQRGDSVLTTRIPSL
jgi:hypothetical protein